MKTLIIGSGATGGFIGARLLECNEDVTFLVRPARKVQLLTTGLNLLSPYGRFRRPVHAISPDELTSSYDLAILATRAHEYDTALNVAAAAINKQTLLLSAIEGVRQFEPVPDICQSMVVPSVFEGRLWMDADGLIHQRSPGAEWHIDCSGAIELTWPEVLVSHLAGRGLRIVGSDRIVSKTWERFAFMAAGIATSVLMRRPLRDAVKFPYGAGFFKGMLHEAFKVGEAAGFNPDRVRSRAYDRAYSLEGRPVQPPQRVTGPDRAGDEAIYLLGEMVGIARRVGLQAGQLEMAWERVMEARAGGLTLIDKDDAAA